MEQRTDRDTERAIDIAIGMATSEGYSSAAQYLATHGIPLRVIIRVLTQPDHRRGLPIKPRVS